MTTLSADKMRKGHMPVYQYFYRWARSTPPLLKFVNRLAYKIVSFFYHIEIPVTTEIGPGLFIGHPYGITINPRAKLGKNCNIHKGVTLGQENRGKRQGAPVIGDCVWIGVNSTIVGRITIGNDVLIAPNSYVNRDIPPHSIVFGNPCIIKSCENATEGYINNKI
mgnify:CR=1 FL=1